MLIDTHIHLEDRKFSRDLPRVISRARDAGIERLVCIADDVATSRQSIHLARRNPGIHATVGVHPQHERRFREGMIEELRVLAGSPEVVAIGEIGIDHHYPDFNPDRQLEVFALQARLATELSLPMVIHCRDAYPVLIDFFRRETDVTARGVVHCFSGDYDQARALLDLGFYLGIGGAITYPDARTLREAVRRIGPDRLVCETDAPYLPPQKRRGRRNEPSYMKFTVAHLAEVLDLTWQDVARITTDNAMRLYGLQADRTPELIYGYRRRLYLNVTNRCTNECVFCQRMSDYMLFGHFLKLDGEPSASAILAGIEDTDMFEELVICGMGEPTMRLDVVLELARALRERGCRIRLNTNGHGSRINRRDITPELAGLVDSVAITMNAHDQETYNRISCPNEPDRSFKEMLDFTRKVRRHVPDVRMKVLALPEVDLERCRVIAEEDLNVRFQVRAWRPNGYPVS